MGSGHQGKYQGYPSHGDAQMPSFSDIPSENLQHHLDQGILKHMQRGIIAMYMHTQVIMHQIFYENNLACMCLTV